MTTTHETHSSIQTATLALKKMTTPVKLFGLAAFSSVLMACGGSDSTGTEIDVEVEPQTSIVDVAVGAGNFTTLVAALQATGLDATLADLDGTYTVFAPDDAAFAKLGTETINALLADTDTLSDILLYHVIVDAEVGSMAAIASAGTTLQMANEDFVGLSLDTDADPANLLVNLSTVTAVDIAADNGVIHVLDTVLIPPTDSEDPVDNIAEIVTNNANFSTLLTALQAAGLDSALANEDATFTVFAPTNAAFDLLPDGTVTALLGDIPALTDILELHVVSGAAVDSRTAFSLSETEVETLGGENVEIEIVDGVLTVGGAAVSTFDVQATNGVIHIIDAVITE